MEKRVPGFALAAAALFAAAGSLQGQVQLTSDATRIDIAGRLQTQLATSSCSSFVPGEDATSPCASDVPGLDLFIRRARLEIDITFNEWISGRIQPDFGEVDGVELKDAYGLLNLQPGADNPHAQIRIGHFKRPFDGFQMTSSTQILTIERDLDIAGISGTRGLSYDELTTRNRLSDRDIGVMVDGGDPGDRFHYWLGVFNGTQPSDNGSPDTKKQLIGRAQVNLAAGPHPLEISAAVAFTEAPFTRSDETLDARYFGNVEIFAELGGFSGGPHVQAGVVLGKNALQNELGAAPDLEGGDPLAGMMTWQAIGAWKIEVGDQYFFEAIEPLFRITMADPNRDVSDDTVWGFTPGVEVFFGGRNKIALNWDFVAFGDETLDGANSFKAQYQFHF